MGEWEVSNEGWAVKVREFHNMYIHAHRKSPSLPLSFVCAKKERLEGARNAIPGNE